jgi:hypothetical protein
MQLITALTVIGEIEQRESEWVGRNGANSEFHFVIAVESKKAESAAKILGNHR